MATGMKTGKGVLAAAAAAPPLAVSISIVSPAGETISVALPPSTSIR